MYHLHLCIEETRAKKVEPPSLQYTCHIAPPTRNEQRATPLSFRFSADKLKIRFAHPSHIWFLLLLFAKDTKIISSLSTRGGRSENAVKRWDDLLLYNHMLQHPPTIHTNTTLGLGCVFTIVWYTSILE